MEQDTKFDPAGNKASATPLRTQSSSTTKRIPEGWVPLAGDESSEQIDKLKNGEEKLRRAQQERRSWGVLLGPVFL